MEPVLGDIQHLNEWAVAGRYPVTKLSFSCLGRVLDDYVLLPAGAALGRGCGPKIISNEPFDLADLPNKRIAIPGRDTTAYLLLCILFGVPSTPVFCTYDEITTLLQHDAVDCGLIIHETRFTFAAAGFVEIADLGELWERQHNLPLPLGGIAAKRCLGIDYLEAITRAVQQSIAFARRQPDACTAYILDNSQEKQQDVVDQHIALYVNDDSVELSPQGVEAIDTLLTLARDKQLLPKNNNPWMT